MATKQELAEQLTVEELRDLASEHGVDLAGASNKSEIVERVTASLTKDDLAGAQSEDSEAEPTASAGTTAGGTEKNADTAAESTTPASAAAPGGPENQSTLASVAEEIRNATPLTDAAERSPSDQTSPTGATLSADATPGELVEAKATPADLELRLPQGAVGPPIIRKVNPETPTPQQVVAAVGETTGHPEVTAFVTDADGNEFDAQLTPSDAATVAQRALSAQPQHPAFTSQGHWSNPNFPVEMTDEQREKDQAAYAERVSAG